jgi:hypothetical protein
MVMSPIRNQESNITRGMVNLPTQVNLSSKIIEPVNDTKMSDNEAFQAFLSRNDDAEESY